MLLKKASKWFNPVAKCPDEVYKVMRSYFELHAKNRLSFAVVQEQIKDLHCKDPMCKAGRSGSE